MKRRKYQKDYTAFARVIALTELFNEHELRRLFLPTRMSFQLLLNGEAEDQDVGRLIDIMNVTLVRSWGTDAQPVANTAVEALKRCYARWVKLGVWGLDGPARADIEQGIELHEQLCRLSTPRQMRDAALVVERMKDGNSIPTL
jgi:hypothetical protein